MRYRPTSPQLRNFHSPRVPSYVANMTWDTSAFQAFRSYQTHVRVRILFYHPSLLENSENSLELGRITKRDSRTNLFPVSSVGRLLDLEFLLSDREVEGARERVFEFISLDRNLIFALPSPRILSVPYRSTGILTPTLRALHDPPCNIDRSLGRCGSRY